MEAWVQAKITKAADYIASVYHYLEYEMKISEYGTHLETAEMYSEGQKAAIKNKLMEAKEKVKELKKLQAEKKSKEDAKSSVKEGIMSGGEESCTECGGTGMVYREATPVPDHVKGKVEKYKRQATAFHAASKRIDKNKNGIPDDEEVSEEQGELKKTGDSKKTPTGTLTKTDTGVVHKNTSYSDGGDADEQSGKGKKSHAKAQSAAEKKELAPKQKQSPKSAKTWGMKDGAKFDNRDKAVDETYGQGVYAEGKGDGNLANNAKPYDKVTRGDVIAGRLGKDEKGGKDKKVKETLKGDQDKIDVDGDKKIEKSDLAALRAGKKVDEASKPSAGMSKKEKSDTVKDAKAGKDIGKPGKSFDKVAKAAGGGEKGEKIAAAAMWKNKAKAMKESLDSMTTSLPAPEADDMAIGESDTQNELGALVKYASEKDPEGFAAAQNDPAKLFQFLQQFAEKDASDTGTGGAIGAPNTMPQAMEQTESDMVFESTEFDRMKTLMQRLNG
jgi:hypothetical protein